MTFRNYCVIVNHIENVKSSDEESTRTLRFTENIPGVDTLVHGNGRVIQSGTILLRGMK